MYSPFRLAYKYLRYYIGSSNGKGHGIHSPFVFDFIKNVLNRTGPPLPELENIRNDLRKDERIITVDDPGAGSGIINSKQRRVKDIASTSLKPVKYARLLKRITEHYKSNTVVELGTSFGITTCYLAAGGAQIYTLEGAESIASVAEENFKDAGYRNIKLVKGNFDDTLLPLLKTITSPDVVFIDGNHKKEATLRYFSLLLPYCHETSIMVFDDIHWSAEMENAWKEIGEHPSVTLTIDLFFIGIVFFRKEFKVKQHFCIRF